MHFRLRPQLSPHLLPGFPVEILFGHYYFHLYGKTKPQLDSAFLAQEALSGYRVYIPSSCFFYYNCTAGLHFCYYFFV